MALTFTGGKNWSNGDIANSTNLNSIVDSMTYAGALEVAKGGTGATNVATALTSFNLFQSFANNTATNITQAGTLGGDLVFSNGPTVSLTAGTWLLGGAVTARTSDASDSIYPRFYNNTDGSAFGYGSAIATESLSVRHSLSCFGYTTVASGTKVIYFKVFRSASTTLDVGAVGTGVPAGTIWAVQLY